MPREHIHFVTGRLAEHALRSVVQPLSRGGRLRLFRGRDADFRSRPDDPGVDRSSHRPTARDHADSTAGLLCRRLRAHSPAGGGSRRVWSAGLAAITRVFWPRREARTWVRSLRHCNPGRDQSCPSIEPGPGSRSGPAVGRRRRGPDQRRLRAGRSLARRGRLRPSPAGRRTPRVDR